MAEETAQEEVAALVGELSGPSRRRRQEVAHLIAARAKEDPEVVAPHVDALVEALELPEAQTRWEVLDVFGALVATRPDAAAAAFDGAEASLFDDVSATVRLSAFTYLCRLGASSEERSDQVWPLLDEAIQCYHGDAEYHDMLVALLGLAQGSASASTRASLAARVEFDAKNGPGYVRSLSAQILQACA